MVLNEGRLEELWGNWKFTWCILSSNKSIFDEKAINIQSIFLNSSKSERKIGLIHQSWARTHVEYGHGYEK